MTQPFLPPLALFTLLGAPGMLLAQGEPLGPEFRANTYTTNDQRRPSVASDPAGNFVIVWASGTQDGNMNGVFAQRYSSTGAPLGGEFRVNSHTPSRQWYPSVASDSAGNFVVAWVGFFQDGWGLGVFAQRYASTGAPLGGEFQVNIFTPYHQSGPSVASDSAGNFIVTWTSTNQEPDASAGVFARRYANTGSPLGGEFHVNTYITGNQFFQSVASDSAGNFVVVWTGSWDQDGSGYGVFARRYASTGAPLGGEFRVNTFTFSHQRYPSVASDSAGNFVVVWESNQEGLGGFGIYAQRYASTGVPLGGEFHVNTYTTSSQGTYVSVASNSTGNFVVAWTSSNQDGNLDGVFAQRYSMIVPVELQSFGVE